MSRTSKAWYHAIKGNPFIPKNSQLQDKDANPIYFTQGSNPKNNEMLHSLTWNKKRIAQILWQDVNALISDEMVEKMNIMAKYLYAKGYELKGIKSDGNCFCNAFLESYDPLPEKFPSLICSKIKSPI